MRLVGPTAPAAFPLAGQVQMGRLRRVLLDGGPALAAAIALIVRMATAAGGASRIGPAFVDNLSRCAGGL